MAQKCSYGLGQGCDGEYHLSFSVDYAVLIFFRISPSILFDTVPYLLTLNLSFAVICTTPTPMDGRGGRGIPVSVTELKAVDKNLNSIFSFLAQFGVFEWDAGGQSCMLGRWELSNPTLASRNSWCLADNVKWHRFLQGPVVSVEIKAGQEHPSLLGACALMRSGNGNRLFSP